ncbi:uncharacterized protein EV420DRAFT_1484303 [Desarmillaria tabescens]|uniref:Uncharacterized protein n=1 Tax=Armillaria tabescens TaxID=1929756 RepID=A0AA39JQL0_ARMTA|nr:uncharacterized protein EV420DRAFT_1484303 [Desarmillaria tabescens]KAK0445674.1 hypothetical protein EV420DRAFT_1484303 [Desarmillaria tabescens]
MSWWLLWSIINSTISVAAQDLMLFTSWKNPNIMLSKDGRISIPSAALEKVVSLDSTHATSSRLYTQIAEFDTLTNQTKYKETLKQGFMLAKLDNSEFLNTMSLNYGLNYGYAAAWDYITYQDPDFLNFSARKLLPNSWSATAFKSQYSARHYMISKEQAASGTTDVKQFNLSTSCPGTTSLVGGTYWKLEH